MLHFGATLPMLGAWGTRVHTQGGYPSYPLYSKAAQHSWKPQPGQTTGGMGTFYTETGQPITASAGGAYTLNTYLTTYAYAQGQYTFALEVHLSLSESLSVGDSAAVNMIYGVSLAEALGVAGAESGANELAVAITDALSMADAYTFNVIYELSVEETLRVSDAIRTNAALTAYVTNLNTGAVSTYNNFNFNSFAKIGNKYYGAGDDGIYELAGDTDDGTNIDVSIKLGTEDFASETISPQSMKRVPTAYLGVKTDGSVLLKVTANGATNTYTLSATTQTSLHTGRLMLGKGVASRYWDFEINNVDGSDITLESVTFYPVALTRRIVES